MKKKPTKKKRVVKPAPAPEPPPAPPPARPLLDLRHLEETVTRMRNLGVTEWEGIKLGPEPPAEPRIETPEEKAARKREREIRTRDIQFAACRVRPLIKGNEK